MKMFLLFSHRLTSRQIEDAKSSLKVDKFIYLPENLQDLWSKIPPHIEDISPVLLPLKNFLKTNAKRDDFILIQGDFGATCNMVNFAKQNGFIPIYSTNKRVAKEYTDGNKLIKMSEFIHNIYRRF